MRMYNGCPDSELKTLIESDAEADRKLRQLERKLGQSDGSARAVYFPNGAFFQGFIDNEIVGPEFSNKFACINYLIDVLSPHTNTDST